MLILPVLFSLFAYRYTAATLERQTYAAGEITVRQLRDVVDERLAQVCDVGDIVYLSSSFSRIRYLSLPFTAEKYYELHQRGGYLGNFTAQQSLMRYIYVYYGDMDCLLDATHIYTELNQLNSVITQRIGISRARFAALMGQTHLSTFRIFSEDGSILYLRTLDTRGDDKRPILTLIVVLNMDSINAILKNTSINMQGSAYILQADSPMLNGVYTQGDPTSYEQVEALSGVGRGRADGVVVAYADSAVSDFRFVLSVPYASFYEALHHMHFLFFCGLTGILLLGILVAYLLARKNYLPLHSLKQAAHLTAKGQDDFAVLGRKLTELLDSQEKMYDAVHRLDRLASEQLFHTLLCGDPDGLDALQMEQLHSLFTGNLFVVATIQLDDCYPGKGAAHEPLDAESASVLLNKLTADMCYGICQFVIRREEDAHVAVFCFAQELNPNDAQLTVRDNMQTLLTRLTQHLSLSATICVGGAHTSIHGIRRSYVNAVKANEYAEFAATTGRQQVVLFNETMFSTDVSWREYDIVDAERRFISLMLDGNYAGGEQVLHEILAYYGYRDGMSLYVMRCRMFGVMNMMLNVLHEVEPDIDAIFYEEVNPVETLLSARTMKELEDALFFIINRMIGRKEGKTSDIYNKIAHIEHYVATHYYQWDLSVQQIADTFGISLPYLSRMFKRERGIGLLDYIKQYRVAKAKEIMAENESLTVYEVAASVGYNNSQTFIRIFKHYEGVTPGSYRSAQEDGAAPTP